ncbi:Hypothetical_protein [Hexamita inflata]|uniref:Hypothetical_protein n=1 Tax=Hexamita inflata TaxID=28002 RepID=A0ABP1JF42_9EUKA
MNELKLQSDTKRVQDHHTNRINIVNQISQDRLKEIEKLSCIVAKALQGSTLEDVSEIGQIYEFWENFQKSVKEEYSMKKTKTVLLVNERNITIPCRCIRYTNPKEAMKEFQEIYNENHVFSYCRLKQYTNLMCFRIFDKSRVEEIQTCIKYTQKLSGRFMFLCFYLYLLKVQNISIIDNTVFHQDVIDTSQQSLYQNSNNNK